MSKNVAIFSSCRQRFLNFLKWNVLMLRSFYKCYCLQTDTWCRCDAMLADSRCDADWSESIETGDCYKLLFWSSFLSSELIFLLILSMVLNFLPHASLLIKSRDLDHCWNSGFPRIFMHISLHIYTLFVYMCIVRCVWYMEILEVLHASYLYSPA